MELRSESQVFSTSSVVLKGLTSFIFLSFPFGIICIRVLLSIFKASIIYGGPTILFFLFVPIISIAIVKVG